MLNAKQRIRAMYDQQQSIRRRSIKLRHAERQPKLADTLERLNIRLFNIRYSYGLLTKNGTQ